ncbi:hypothetical protein ABI59_11380 [Acidobacteria bacterium Mor1]|nr:hypothetical protein ABI59_11380 [Acidobacteria bacterium Mor1]
MNGNVKLPSDPYAEWLETDGRGGYASGTVCGVRTRRYHALLLTAREVPTDRVLLVNGIEAWIDLAGTRYPLSSQQYRGDMIHPEGHRNVLGFRADPWPRWEYAVGDARVVQELVISRRDGAVGLRFTLRGATRGRLSLRLLLSGRDPHALHQENDAFRFDVEEPGEGVRVFRPYDSVPPVTAWSTGSYRHEPDWYRGFEYQSERARGLDHEEDLATPGVFEWDIEAGHPVWLGLAAGDPGSPPPVPDLFEAEQRRREAYPSAMHRAADDYVVTRGEGKSIIAGYPWFGDWGRDTFIAMRGLLLATERLDEAGQVLSTWAGALSEGMLPNRFPDGGGEPEYNAVDASLWFAIVVHEWLAASERAGRRPDPERRDELLAAVRSVLRHYRAGTRYGIRACSDGLLAAGVPGQQLTWMDARVADWVVTPRVGKPVEVQALWLNALDLSAGLLADDTQSYPDGFAGWDALREAGNRNFVERFWDSRAGYLHDVVDVDHVAGTVDSSFRPNQILAVGGLPRCLLNVRQAARVVEKVSVRLETPLGLRSLAPGESAYAERYRGGVIARDAAYHQGTVWPWLSGPYIEAWLRVHGDDPGARLDARRRFIDPLLEHLGQAGLGHLSEIADAEPPHQPRGCPFQAWSLGELLRLLAGPLRFEPSRPAEARDDTGGVAF